MTFNGLFDHNSVNTTDVRVVNLSNGNVLNEHAPTGVASDRLRVAFADNEYLDHGIGPVRLPDGYYELTLNADGIFDPDGSTLKADAAGTRFPDGRYSSGTLLRHLNADFNGDGRVNISDFSTYLGGRNNGGTTFAQGDADGNGVVDDADYAILQRQFGRRLEAPPTRPGEVLATLATAATIEVSWVIPPAVDPAQRPDAWHLYRGEGIGIDFDAEPVAILSNTDADETNDFSETVGTDGILRGHFTDTGLRDGTRYRYDLRAWSAAAGLSPATDAAEEWTTLVAPTDLRASFLSNGSVLLEWDLGGDNASHNVIEYRTGPSGQWLSAAEVHGLQNQWVVAGLPGTPADVADYEFRVKSELRDSPGDIVLETLFTDAVEPELVAPTGVIVTTVAPHARDELSVTWTRGDTDQTLHRLEVSNDGGHTWSAPPTGDVTWAFGEELTVTGLPDNTTYHVRVRGELVVYGGGGQGTTIEASEWATAEAVYIPVLAPADLNATAVGDGTVRINWTGRGANVQSYAVERRNVDGDVWTAVATLEPGDESAVDRTAVRDERYIYRVSAIPTSRNVGVGYVSQRPHGRTDDKNDVDAADADAEHLGVGGWGGNLYQGGEAPVSVSATATEMNGGHDTIRVAAATSEWIITETGASQEELGEVLAFAQSLVGLSSEEEIKFNGESIWKETLTIESVRLTSTVFGYAIELVPGSRVAVTPHGNPLIDSAGRLNIYVPSTAHRATAAVHAGGSLTRALADPSNPHAERFRGGTSVALVGIQPIQTSVSIGVYGQNGTGNGESLVVSEQAESVVNFIVSRAGPNNASLTVGLIQLDGSENLSTKDTSHMTERMKADHQKRITAVQSSKASPEDFYESWPSRITFDVGVGEVVVSLRVKNDDVADGFKDPETQVPFENGSERLILSVQPTQDVFQPVGKPAGVIIGDNAKWFYTNWEQTIQGQPRELRRVVATEHHVRQAQPVMGQPRWVRDTYHLEHREEWTLLEDSLAQSEGWLNDEDGDGEDDNDRWLQVSHQTTQRRDFSWRLSVTTPIFRANISQSGFAATTEKVDGINPAVRPGNNEKMAVAALVRSASYYELYDEYRSSSAVRPGGYHGSWEGPVEFRSDARKVADGDEQPARWQKVTWRLSRVWIDSDSAIAAGYNQSEPVFSNSWGSM